MTISNIVPGFAVAVVLTALPGMAAEYVWKTSPVDDWDFENPMNFTAESGSPQSGDTVCIPGGVTVRLDPSAHPGSWSVASSLVSIRQTGATADNPAVVEVTVSSGSASLNCMIPSGGYRAEVVRRLRLDKKGAGELTLAVSTNMIAYTSHLHVEEGVLAFPGDVSVPTSVGSMCAGVVEVEEGAVFKVAGNGRNTSVYDLLGKGSVSSEDIYSNYLHFYNSLPLTFNGSLDGKLRPSLYTENGSPVYLCGTNSTFTRSIWCTRGVLGVRTFGVNADGKSSPSSLGANTLALVLEGCGKVVCLGTEPETTWRGLQSTNGFTLDGGEYGAVTFNGQIGGCGTPATTIVAVLDGVNAGGACVIGGTFAGWTSGDHDYSYYLVKRGAGAWRLKDVAHGGYRDGVAVEEGVLETEAFNAVGTDGALGFGDRLTHGVGGEWQEWMRAPYALSLGGTNAANPGILAHVGAKAVDCADRPAVVKGFGGLRNDSSRPFLFSGVSAFSNDVPNHVFVLTGTNTDENTVRDVTDALAGTGRLSVEKTGSGLWLLAGGNLTFSGGLDVREGTLVISNPNRYRWFRFTSRQTWGSYKGSSDAWRRGLRVAEIAVYDAQRNRLNAQLACTVGELSADTGIKAGEAWLSTSGARYKDDGSEPVIAGAFDEYQYSGSVLYFPSREQDPDDPSTWVSIDFRLGYRTPEVTAFNWMWQFAPGTETEASPNINGVATPRIVDLSASADGQNWTVLNVHTNTGSAISVPAWAVSPEDESVDTRIACMAADRVLPNVAYVRVAPGATLEAEGPVALKSYRIDAQGVGTLRGFAFAEDGMVDVTGVDGEASATTLDGTYENVSGLGNLTRWTLRVNGAPAAEKYVLRYRDGQLVLKRRVGLTVVFR